MIAKVVRGYRPGGLLAYLFGPGRHEEHRDPRVVASWDGAPWLHQPEPAPRPGVAAAGEFDLDLRSLIAAMEAEPRRLGLPVRTPPALPRDSRQLLVDGRRVPAAAPAWARMWRYDAKFGEVVLRPGYVWHCPVRLAPGDRTLSDAEWEHVAERLMRAVGIHQAGCRWVAVRHADDHIHLMATLVSETTGKRFHPYRDFLQLREECRAVEREFCLTATAPADRTARPASTRGERAKAQPWGREETTREFLHRVVAHAAATNASSESFFAVLRERRLDPVARRDANGQIVGYTVGVPFERGRDGKPIRYGGRALAPDLTWPKLCARWTSSTENVPGQRSDTPVDATPPETGLAALLARRHAAFDQAAATANGAAGAVRGGAQGGVVGGAVGAEQAESIAHAAGELLTALAAKREYSMIGGPLTAIAIRYDRAARTPGRVLASSDGALARDLRGAARQLAASGSKGEVGSAALAFTALVVALGSLVAEIAAWQHACQRPHQAHAAADTATSLQRLAAAHAAPRPAVPATRAASPTTTPQPAADTARTTGSLPHQTPHRRAATYPAPHNRPRTR